MWWCNSAVVWRCGSAETMRWCGRVVGSDAKGCVVVCGDVVVRWRGGVGGRGGVRGDDLDGAKANSKRERESAGWKVSAKDFKERISPTTHSTDKIVVEFGPFA